MFGTCFGYAVLSFVSSCTIILAGKRELGALLKYFPGV